MSDAITLSLGLATQLTRKLGKHQVGLFKKNSEESVGMTLLAPDEIFTVYMSLLHHLQVSLSIKEG